MTVYPTTVYTERDLERVGVAVHDGQGGYRPDKRVQKRYDLGGTTYLYVGVAPIGTSAAAAAWTIKRITQSGGNPILDEWTTVGTAVWDNRVSETYL